MIVLTIMSVISSDGVRIELPFTHFQDQPVPYEFWKLRNLVFYTTYVDKVQKYAKYDEEKEIFKIFQIAEIYFLSYEELQMLDYLGGQELLQKLVKNKPLLRRMPDEFFNKILECRPCFEITLMGMEARDNSLFLPRGNLVLRQEEIPHFFKCDRDGMTNILIDRTLKQGKTVRLYRLQPKLTFSFNDGTVILDQTPGYPLQRNVLRWIYPIPFPTVMRGFETTYDWASKIATSESGPTSLTTKCPPPSE